MSEDSKEAIDFKGMSLEETITLGQQYVEELERKGYPKAVPLGSLFTKFSEQAGIYPVPNLAVELCTDAYAKATKEQLDAGTNYDKATQIGKLAYGIHMPKLSGADNVRDFIACVAHGMLIGIIPSSEGTRLLYAAQVANAALPSPKRRKKCSKTSQKQPINPDPTPDTSTT
jgi:hypothetical protein